MTAHYNKSISYRPEIDGLRALAVIPVILFHAGFTLLSGGFVGVDIFFVISGYLITAILIKELATGRFSILEFYKRRARRILPALFFVIACCLPFAWLLLTPDDLKRFGASLFSVSIFSSNLYFWRNTDYFAPVAEDQPLLHTWSLSVEEQFYLFFPALLLLIYPLGKFKVFLCVATITLISFLLCEWTLHNFPVANFYLLPTRAWELLLGSIIALVYFWRPQTFNAATLNLKNLYSTLGFLMIVGSIFFMDNSTPFPSIYTIFPVLGSALIIAFASTETMVGKILSLKAMILVGLISYSAYLWHQPIFVFSRLTSTIPLESIDYLIPIAITLALSIFSLNYIEKPFRIGKFSTKKTLGASLIALTVMGAAGLSSYFYDGFEGRLNPIVASELNRYSNYASEKSVGDCVLLSARRANENFSPDCFGPDDNGPKIYLIGDSHASALAPSLIKKMPNGHNLVQLTITGCYPVLGNNADAPARCKNLSDSRFDHIKDNEESIVLLHANWPAEQLIGKTSNLRNALENTIDHILEKVKPEQIFIVGCVPTWSPTLPKFLLQKGLLGEKTIPSHLYNRNFEDRKLCNNELEKIATKKSINFNNPMAVFCQQNTCLTHIKNQQDDGYTLTTHDETHLTSVGADILVNNIMASALK